MKMESKLEGLIFWSRWLQAPLYVGLIVAQGVYVFHFLIELWALIKSSSTVTDSGIMLGILGLIDVVMVANLLIMVIVGGYETFVSRLDLDAHEDKPEWLNHVNAGVLKVKLATALIGISSIHLLKAFIQAGDNEVPMNERALFWKVIIHVTFVLSALLLAWTDKVMVASAKANLEH